MNIDDLKNTPKKRAELEKLFETLPVVTLVGVVNAFGPSGGKSKGEVLWTWNFTLLAWRQLGQPLQTRPLLVGRKMVEEERNSLMDLVKKNSLVTFQAKLCEDSPLGFPEAQFVSLLPPTSDTELEQILQESLKEVAFEDADLGRFVLDKSLGWFEGEITWLEERVPVYLDLHDEEKYPHANLQIAKNLQADAEEWLEKMKIYAAECLLELKNGQWLEDDEEPLQPEEFKQRMRLESFSIGSDGSFSFSFDDGDLFWGHSIDVSGSLTEGLTDASF